MVLMKQLRMNTIPQIGVNKATIIIVTTSNANIFSFVKNPVNRGHCCSDNVLFRILVDVRMSPEEGELFEIQCNIQIIHASL
jgi:hypothetical protein